MLRDSGLGACGIQQAEVDRAVATDDINKAWRRAMELSCTNRGSEKANVAHGRNPDKHSLEVVGILKQAMDKEDKYLIYKINNSQFNGVPDYIFIEQHSYGSFGNGYGPGWPRTSFTR